MKNISSIILIAVFLLPNTALAAPATGAELVSRIAAETKPTSFTYKSETKSSLHEEKIVITGAREGKNVAKAWERITIDWKGEGSWYSIELELRAKGGTAYAILKRAKGSEGSIIASLRPLVSQWFVLGSLNDEHIAEWFTPNIASLSSVVPFLDVKYERFRTGHSYSFRAHPEEGTRIGTALNAVSPFMIRRSFPNQVDVAGKMDMSNEGEFRFLSAQLSSTHEEASHSLTLKAQRQFSAVYTETPKKTLPISEGAALADVLFGSSGVSMTEDIPAMKEESAPVNDPPNSLLPNHDSSAEMTLPPLSDPVGSRLLRRTSDRAIVNIMNTESTNVKLSVRVVNATVSWDSIADFRSDFNVDDGILFVYNQPITPSFSTRGAFSALDVAFFDASGDFVSSARMDRCYGNSCPFFSPSRPSLYALQLPDGALLKHRISALSRLTFDRYSLNEVQKYSSRALIDRAAKRRRYALNTAKKFTKSSASDLVGHEKMVTLAKQIAMQVRPADVRNAVNASSAKSEASKTLYSVLKQAEQKNADVRYALLVVPRPGQNAFSLLVDTYTYAPEDVLDVNKDGKVTSDESPASVGSVYVYSYLTSALLGATVDTSVSGEISVYVPIFDEERNPIAILGIVQDTMAF